MNVNAPVEFPFTVMAKPVGSTCNLNCTYCYYLEKEKLYHENPFIITKEKGKTRHQTVMSEKLLEKYIAQVIYSSQEPVVVFAWHGGEPILRGMDFFRKIIQYQKKHGEGRTIENSLQTNGTTLTDEWCRFFKDHQFLIGISIDGPEHCHNRYRVYRSGQGSFKQCMKGLELLIKHRIEFNTLTVVNDYSSKYPLEIYRFLKSIGSRYMQFLPVVERVNPTAKPDELRIVAPDFENIADVTDWTVDPVDYGNYLIRIFDEWVRNDVGEYFVLTFDCVLENWMGVPPSVCVTAKSCGHAGAMEYNGDVYACDHYVFPEYKLGNINEKSLSSLMSLPFQLQFGHDKYDKLPFFCRNCEFLDLCNGECPKNRIVNTPDGEPGLNYLCPGFKMFFKHSLPYFEFMANELQNKRMPANVKKWAATRHVRTLNEV